MDTFSALLAICAGNSPVSGEFPAQRPVARSFDVYFDLRLNKRLSKQSWDWWFETQSRPLWRHRNEKTHMNMWTYVDQMSMKTYHDGVIKCNFSTLLALCKGNPPVTGEFPYQRLVTRSFDVLFALHLSKRLSKQSTRRWCETPSRSLWQHCNMMNPISTVYLNSVKSCGIKPWACFVGHIIHRLTVPLITSTSAMSIVDTANFDSCHIDQSTKYPHLLPDAS